MPGERSYGQDHDHYDWSPIVNRPVLRWPDNARVAVCAIVNLEHFDWDMPPDAPAPVSMVAGAMGSGGLGSGIGPFPNIAGYSQHEYGNRVGVFRVLKVLDKYGIRPTIAMDKTVAENYPFLVRECQKRDSEFIAHGITVRQIIHAGYVRSGRASLHSGGHRRVGESHGRETGRVVRPGVPGVHEHAGAPGG